MVDRFIMSANLNTDGLKITTVTKLQVAEVLSGLVEENRPLLELYDPENAIRALDRLPPEAPYHRIPEELARTWKAIVGDFGEEGFGAFQKITMLRLIERFDERSQKKRYSESILDRFGISIQRVFKSIIDPEFRKYHNRNDILLKDLAICRQKVFPAGGARVVEPYSGFPRSLAIRGGPIQALEGFGLLIRFLGNKPLYSHHTHLSELEEFNPIDFQRCNLRLADMLKLNPEIRGVHCGSWLYDPALEEVSPHLAYMRKLQADNGALVFHYGVSLDGGALSKSKTRKRLYEQGRYTPRSYHVIWPRERIIRWADRVDREGAVMR